MDTISRIVVYQHLFAQICIFLKDTIGYKRYNLKMKVDYQGLFKQRYIYKKTKKFVWTFASYDEKDEVFSDRNIFPKGCILKMQKLDV